MIVSNSNLQQPNDSFINDVAPTIPTDPNKNGEMSVTVMKKILQPLKLNAKFKDDAIAMFPPCVSKFINFVTSKAYEKCRHEHRKILNAEDLLWAMDNLGFKDYVWPLGFYLDRYRQIEGNLSTNNGSLPEPRLGSSVLHGSINGSLTNPVYGSGFAALNALQHAPTPLFASELAVGMPPATLPPPSLPSSSQGFSMESNANLDMVAPMMSMNEFFGDGSINEFDPSIFLNLNYEDNIWGESNGNI